MTDKTGRDFKGEPVTGETINNVHCATFFYLLVKQNESKSNLDDCILNIPSL